MNSERGQCRTAVRSCLAFCLGALFTLGSGAWGSHPELSMPRPLHKAEMAQDVRNQFSICFFK